MATKIGVIDGGCLVQVGTPREIYETPANVYVAQRLGQPSINLMPRRLLPDLPVPGEAALIGARTEHLRIVRAEKSAAQGRVTWIEHLGDQNHLNVAIEEQEVVTLADPDSDLAVGDDVGVRLVQPLFFDADGVRINA